MKATLREIGGLANQPVPHVSRVLIVDDSMFSRAVFRKLIEEHAHFEVTGRAADAEQALQFLQSNKVDIVLLDIEMPGRSGLEALPEILLAANGAPVLVISSHAESGSKAAIEALSLGACDTLAKPSRDNLNSKFCSDLIAKLIQIGNLNDRIQHSLAKKKDPESQPSKELKCIAIGASTGGIPAINSFLKSLDRSIVAPILITQHLPETFLPSFTAQVKELSQRPTALATDNLVLHPGHIYVAPGNAHLTCRKHGSKVRAKLLDQKQAGQYCPAVDPMFSSVSDCYGAEAVLVLFSGMGRDGLIGAQMHAARHGSVLVQDEESCVVWGMPGSAALAGIAEAILPPPAIASYIFENWTGGAR